MAPYIPPNRKRFVVPKKILEKVAKADPLPTTIFPFERLPIDILIYILSDHLTLPDRICLCLTSKRFLHLLTSVDSTASPVLHYPTSQTEPIARKPNASNNTHDSSPYLIPILRRLQSHKILGQDKIPCHSCCRLRRSGTKSHWWDICEEVYSTKTWRRRRNDRAYRRVVDYEYHEFMAAFGWAWKIWKSHEGVTDGVYRFMETDEGGYESQRVETDTKSKGGEEKGIEKAMENLRIEEPAPICPECWAAVEAKKISLRPPLRY